MGIRVALLAAGALACGSPAAGPEGPWGQTQSHLEVLAGRPLVSANWHGRHRPYVHDGANFVPVMRPEPPGVGELDLYRPLAVSTTRLLMAGTESGRTAHDIFLYDVDAGTLANLTASPSVDDGRLCLHAESRRVAYRSGTEQRFAAVSAALEPFSQSGIAGFDHCTFVDADVVLGVERRRSGPLLHRCRIHVTRVDCGALPLLADVEHVLGFITTRSGETGVIARRRGAPFREAFLFDPELSTLRAVSPDPPIEADVLAYDGDAFRIGSESRYHSTLDPDFDGIVYRTRRIGTTDYAILATASLPRTLARLGPGGWEPLAAPTPAPPGPIAAPRELWLSSQSGERYQAFRFGPDETRRIVVWWHGGPHENVSPRFNPYFHALGRMGYAVLAVNYPGSTGRGAGFERRFERDSVADCLQAVWSHLEDSAAEQVISWSVSSGVTVQSLLLASSLPLDAAVDQSGWGRSQVVAQAARRDVPIFVIRGRNDANAPSPRVDHWYADGHDITMAEQFEDTMSAVQIFLSGLQR